MKKLKNKIGLIFLIVVTIVCSSCRKSPQITINKFTTSEKEFLIKHQGKSISIGLITSDEIPLDEYSVTTIDLGPSTLVVINDINGVYLPDLLFVSGEEESIIRRLKNASSYPLGSNTASNVNIEPLMETLIGETSVGNLNQFLEENYQGQEVSLMFAVPENIDESTSVSIFESPIKNVLLAVFSDLITVKTRGDTQRIIVDTDSAMIKSASIITFLIDQVGKFSIPLLDKIIEQQNTYNVANFIGTSIDEVYALQDKADRDELNQLMASSDSKSNLENDTFIDLFLQTWGEDVYAFIRGAKIITENTDDLEKIGLIFDQSPAPGEEIIPGEEELTLYVYSYHSEIMKESSFAQETEVMAMEPIGYNIVFSGEEITCQEVSDRDALDIVLVIDVSGSMVGARIAAAKSSAINLVNQLDTEMDKIGLVSFTGEASSISDVTSSFSSITNAIENLEAEGGTDIGAGLSEGYSNIMRSGRPNSNKVVILLSDGESEEGPAINSANLIKSQGMILITIGVGDSNLLLSKLASSDIDYLYSRTNQGVRELLELTTQRLVNNQIKATDVSITVTINTDNYELIDSMLPENLIIHRPDRIEMQTPILYEGYEITLPLMVRPVGNSDAPIGIVEISYNECENNNRVFLNMQTIDSESLDGNLTPIQVLNAGSKFEGTLDKYDAQVFALDRQETGVFSVTVEGAGSELAPEILTGDDENYLSPLLTIPNSNYSTSVFKNSDAGSYWMYIQSNSENDRGNYTITINEGLVEQFPKYQVGTSGLNVSMSSEEVQIFEFDGVTEGDFITISIEYEEDYFNGYLRLLSLSDGIFFPRRNYYYISGGEEIIQVYEVFGEGPYYGALTAYTEGMNITVNSELGDVLLGHSGDINLGTTVNGYVEPGFTDEWHFEGGINNLIFARLNPDSYSSGLYLILRQPSGDSYINGSFCDLLLYNQLLEQGPYALMVNNNYGNEEVNYDLTLTEMAAPDETRTAISLGETVAGMYFNGLDNIYEFEGSKGQNIAIRLLPENYYDMYPSLGLIFPDGTTEVFGVFDDDIRPYEVSLSYQLPEDGIYQIIISSNSNSCGGEYQLILDID